MKPHLSKSPVAKNCLRGDAEDAGDLIDTESAKETELDNAALARIGVRKRAQCIIESNEIRCFL